MQIVPVIKSSDLDRSFRSYTEVLDFERKWPDYADPERANGIAHLVKPVPSCSFRATRETSSSTRSSAFL
jgi:hypothetical protein